MHILPALSLRTSETPLVPALMLVGVYNAPSPETGDRVTFLSEDNATASLLLARFVNSSDAIFENTMYQKKL